VDYPGFNMRIADFAHQAGLKVFYYISPQVWAWKQSRVKKLKATVDHMFVILPFEQDFYAKFSYPVDFVGHPLLDAIENKAIEIQPISERPIIAIVPGSRKQEISRMLPVMLSVQDQFPDYDFVIAGAPAISEEYYRQFLSPGTKIVYNQTYNLLRQAKAALVTSGTATLETALFEVPEVVCYSGNTLSYYIARQLIKVKFISLVNLIMDREIVKELIQAEFNTENLVNELRKLLSGGERRETLLQDYKDLKERLGGAGASRKTAQLMLNYLQQSK
jgi:lipid-A-disaccharide synthase